MPNDAKTSRKRLDELQRISETHYRATEATRRRATAIRKRLKYVFTDFRRQGGVAFMSYQRDATSSHGPIRKACKRAGLFKYAHWPRTQDRPFLRGGSLFIYYGSLNRILPQRFVGHELATLCRLYGLKAKWDGSPHHTLEITGLL